MIDSCEERVIKIISDKTEISRDIIRNSNDFENELELESLDRILIIQELESEFNIEFDYDDASKFNNVEYIVSFINNKIR